MTTGFYLMHRGWQDHPVFGAEEFSRRDAWVWLIEHAAHSPRTVGVLGKTVRIERGQLCYSLRYMAKAWGWSEAKVRRYLKRLIDQEMLLPKTDALSDAGQTVLTVCNYDAYQTLELQPDAPADAGATQERRRSDANNNELNQGKKPTTTPPAPNGAVPPQGEADGGGAAPAGEKPEPDEPVPKSDRGHRLPDDWRPSPAHWALAQEIGFTHDEFQHTADEFRDYWAAQPGRSGRKLDWEATFRNRLRDCWPKIVGRRKALGPVGQGYRQSPASFGSAAYGAASRRG